MKNAYTILGVSQNASQSEIVKGQVAALKDKKYSPQEIAIAQKQLRTPHQRLAVDFTFPVFESEKATTVSTNIQAEKIDIIQIDTHVFDSLK